MKDGLPSSLAFLAIAVGLAGAQARSTAAAGAPGKQAASGSAVQLHRCTDAGGKVTWQDDVCPAGSKDELRRMQRPTDPPPRRLAEAPPAPVSAPPEPAPAAPPPRELIPPPPMFLCTSYDGIERYSESYDPNPRCEPMVLYYPYPNNLTPAQALSCRWVEESCVRLSDRAACDRFRAQKVEAASQLQRAFSDTVAYRKSELARLTQIVAEHCP